MSSKSPDLREGAAAPIPLKEAEPRERDIGPLVIAVALVVGSIAVRIAFRDTITSDLDTFVLRWYAKFQDLGIRVGLGKDFYNYSPPYMYFVALSTLTSRWLSPASAIKLISSAFDLYAAFVMYKIARLKYPAGFAPYVAGSLVLAAPTLLANTAIWGQADSSYAAFLLTSLYFLLIDKPLPAMLFFSVSFAFKPQAIFLMPLLIVLALWRRLPWYLFLLVPLVYGLAALPAVAFGRTWTEILQIYLSRPAVGKALTHNAGSLYVFVPRSALDILSGSGILIAGIIILLWIVFAWRFSRRGDRATLLLLAVTSVTLAPFVLPNMHDRYFYPADAISIALAFIVPELWFIPVLFQVSSGLAYSIYLLSASFDNLLVAGSLNLLIVLMLLAVQFLWRRPAKAPDSQAPVTG